MDLSSTLQSTQQDPHKSGVYHHLSLTCIPQEIFTLKSLKSLDLSNNKLTRLPGKIIAQELTLLESLDLQCNMLYMLEDLIDLSTMPRLYELNFIQNPVRLLNNRIYLLEAFFKGMIIQ
jgi:Leucine-rich repeat (LRR) protein